MSIINEAIKKARKESDIEHPGADAGVTGEHVSSISSSSPAASLPASSDIKWTAIIVVSLVITVSLLGSLILYKHITRPSAARTQSIAVTGTAAPPSHVVPLTRPKAGLPVVNTKETPELNGIVYGPVDKWAIINDRIVREGDLVQGGKLLLIKKDFVKIERPDGEEVVLNLR